jgi:HEAT repeat protein
VAAADLTALRAEVGELRQMVSLSLLREPSASDRLKGVAWAADLDGSGTTVVAALLETLANDPNVNVRLASVDALRGFAERDAVRRGAVEALGRQTSPIVQMALIDFVVEARLTAAKDTLSRLATDQTVHETVRARAARGLREVSS